jgi:hypothetical protein
MKNILFLGLIFFTTIIFAQKTGTVVGNVLDNELFNQPLLFANVELKETPYRAHTNLHGNFEIAGVAPGTYTLAIRYPGYETLEMPVLIREAEITKIQQNLSALKITLENVVTQNEIPIGKG